MSGDVFTRGWIGILKTPLTPEEREEFDENAYDNDSKLRVNYEGTLIYSDNIEPASNIYGITFHKKDVREQCRLNDFILDVQAEDIQIEVGIYPYSMFWHNGGDSYVNLLTVDELIKHHE